MEKILFIVNPIAGGGRSNALIPMIEDYMNKYSRDFKIEISEKPEHAIKISEEGLADYQIIVAVGGDGTVNEVAKGIINKGRGVLGIIPGGTGNDMARSLGISMDPKKAIEEILIGNRKMIDVGRINSSNFLNIASVGFDAEVVDNNRKIRKKIKGSISYAISVVYTIFQFKSKPVSIEIDGEKRDENILLLAVGNGKYYGGGIKILPHAELDDGYLHICLVADISKLKLLLLFPSVFKGNHLKHKKHVRTYRARSVLIRSEKDLPLNIDGDVTHVKDVDISLDDEKIELIYKKD